MIYRQINTTRQNDWGDQKILIEPVDIVYDDKKNHLIVSDRESNCLHWFDCNTLQHMNSYGNRNTDLVQLNFPECLCLQPITNRLIVCDSNNHRVHMFSIDDYDSSSNFSTPIPIFTMGKKPDLKAIGSVGIPRGVCCSPNGGIFITDTWNHRVQSFDAGGRFISTFGRKGASDQEFRDPATVCLVHPHFSPSSLASGMLCVADQFNNRVSVWNSNNTDPQHLFNFKVAGYSRGLCVDLKGYLHVSCGFHSHVVQIFDLRMVRLDTNSTNEPALIQTLGTTGSKWIREPTPGEFSFPTGMCIDRVNTLMVADTSNQRIQFFDEKI